MVLVSGYATSLFIIGATFVVFSYFSPILTELSGFSESTVPLLLGIYGAFTIAGNLVIGRLADQYSMPVLAIGLTILAATLAMFSWFVHNSYVFVAAVILIGLTGVTMNPAMVIRISRVGGTGTLVTTVHGSVTSFCIVAGSYIGGVAIDAGYGLSSPLWVGFLLAVLGLLRKRQIEVRQTFAGEVYLWHPIFMMKATAPSEAIGPRRKELFSHR